VKPVSLALACAALIFGVVGGATAYGATETVSLGFKEETGPDPAPFLEPPAVENPVSFKVTYTATPVQPIKVAQYLYCTRGSEHPGTPEQLETVTPPISFTLTAPAGSESCQFAAQSELPVGGVFGTVRIDAEAIRTAKSQPTPTGPAKKKKCKKGKRLRHGKCVKKKHSHRRTR
jgi:hypothetical protein